MKRIISLLLAVLMVLSVTSMTVFAAEENTAKEEVIYINLAADGSVKEVNAVNIFDLAADGKIVDYGNYQTVRNMTTTDKLCYTDDTVTADAKKGKLYYEGKLESNVIPWNVSVHYYMDGNEYTAEQIAGKSGSLKLAVSITENADCEGDFFDGYALQVTVTLDTDIAKNIKTDGATAANIGGDKQFTYTVLPAKGAEIEITADVTDFEMDPISINGVKLDLDIEIDESEIQGKVADITDAAEALDDGAGALKDGAAELHSGAEQLAAAAEQLYSGVGALKSGASHLAAGLNTAAASNDELLGGAYAAFGGLCTASETTLNSSLTAAGLPAVTLTPETYDAVLTSLIAQMSAFGVPTDSVAALKAQLDSYSAFYEGLKTYTAAVSAAASGANELKVGIDALHKNVGTLSTFTAAIIDGAKAVLDGAAELKSGTAEFKNATSDISSQISTEIDSMLADALGSETELTSFVSEKNTNIQSVQFVMQTEAVEVAEPTVAAPIAEEKLNFWQKLLKLFGL